MGHELIKARLNLYAVMKNLENLVQFDPEMAALSKTWNVSIQFSVLFGPKAFIEFQNGRCRVEKGKLPKPSIRLFFISSAHLNWMMDGKGFPIPLKGFTKIPFLNGDFQKLTKKLEYYLKPTEDLLKDEKYVELNTRFTLNTAAHAIPEIGNLDRIGKHAVSHIQTGDILMKILPDGPAVTLRVQNGIITPLSEETDRPMACLYMKNIRVANDFLNAKLDAFTAIASGDVMIKGQTPMLDSMGLILDRIPAYLG